MVHIFEVDSNKVERIVSLLKRFNDDDDDKTVIKDPTVENAPMLIFTNTKPEKITL